MQPPAPPPGHPKTENRKPKTGVLLVNLGTPTAPTAAALRPYLRQFLGDKRVVELPRWFWIPLLYGIIVPLRAPKSAHAYASIWDTKRNQSPLRSITEDQTAALQKRLGNAAIVEHAMRYGQPSIPHALQKLFNQGCTRILLAPLYPQYCSATVGTVVSEAANWLQSLRWQPSLRILPPYYDEPTHIQALAASVKAHLKTLTTSGKPKPQTILASFHGMPLKYCQKGDTYYCHSHKTARLLAEELDTTFHTNPATLPAKSKTTIPPILLTFQSRFGKAEWLKPYTADTLEHLPQQGIRHTAVICPAFAADCVETLEEIALAGKDSFLNAGGKSYSVIPCLNASKGGMDMLESLIRNELQGWL